MRFQSACLLLLALALGSVPAIAQERARPGAAVDPATIRGAGSTLAAPLYAKWIDAYRKRDPKAKLDYAAVGSGEGITRFLADGVDFGASDVALSDEQLATRADTRMIPTTAGMVVLAYNLPGLTAPLKLSRSTYLALFGGKIPKWNDARIQATNPGVDLPNRNIVLVVRQDSSGTTQAFTSHLSAVSPAWRDQGPGVGKLIAWPGVTVALRGNEGVAGRIKITEGAIGYIEYSYAKRLNLPMAQLENRSGNFVAPDEKSGAAALAANVKRIPANLRLALPDPEGEDAYPLVTFSYLLLHGQYPDGSKGATLKQFVDWGLTEGQKLGPALGYIPLPAEVAGLGRAALEGVKTP
jgi:phosphate transport system substrate-binding protein